MAEGTTLDNSLSNRLPRAKRTVIPPKPAPEPELPAQQANAITDEVDGWLPEGFVRKPFGAHVQKLNYPARPGFHRHWFNDYPGRIARALEAGYKHVQDVNGKNVARIVGVAETGNGLNAFLMEIPERWYKEDQAVKDRARDELDAKMKRGIIKDHSPGHDGAYLPVSKTGTVGPDIKLNGQ